MPCARAATIILAGAATTRDPQIERRQNRCDSQARMRTRKSTETRVLLDVNAGLAQRSMRPCQPILQTAASSVSCRMRWWAS